MATEMIKGIFVPNTVPFDGDGRVNEGELRRMVSWFIEKGLSGLYPNGSTGEFIRLSFEERVRLVEVIADETAGRVPILAGAAESNLELTLEACGRYADMGCRAVSITPPYYYKVSQESIEEYFRKVAAASPIDIVVYNIPQFANEITLPVVTRLALDCPRIVGTKDSSRDMPRFLNTLNDIKPQRPEFSVLVGCEEILFPTLMMGGDGGTIATSGVIPEVIMKLYHDFHEGRWDSCKQIQFKLLEVINTMLFSPNFPEGFRQGYSLRGFDMGESRFPVSEAESGEMADIRSRLACILADCGFSEAASACQASGFERKQPFTGELSGAAARGRETGGKSFDADLDVDGIVRDVMRSLGE